jgi:hypothetical protein
LYKLYFMIPTENSISVTRNFSDSNATNVVMASFSDFKEILIDLSLNLSKGEGISIGISSQLLHFFKTDTELSTFLNLIDFRNEDRFSLPINQRMKEEGNISILSQYQNEMRLFLDSYYHLNAPRFNNNNFGDLINQYVGTQKTDPQLNFNKWFISLEEYCAKEALLIEAKTLFEKLNFYALPNNSKLTINDSLEKDEVVAYLTNLVDELIYCKQNIEKEIKKISKKWKNDATAIFKEIYNNYFLVKEAVTFYTNHYDSSTPKKPGLLNFSKSEKSQYEQFETLKKQCIELCILFNHHYTKSAYSGPLNNLEEISIFLNEVNSKLSNWSNEINDNLMERMNRISTLNIDNEILSVAAASVNAHIFELNSKNILNQKFEINTNVFTKYISFLDELIEHCDDIIIEYNDIDANKMWKSFLSALSKKDFDFISKFFKIESSLWLQEFESYFYEKLLVALQHPLTVNNQARGNELFSRYLEVKNIKISKAYNRLLDIFNDNFAKLQTNDPKLIKQFLKEKKEVNKQDFYKEDIKVICNLFPIKIYETYNDDINVTLCINGSHGVKDMAFSISPDDAIDNLEEINTQMSDIPTTEKFSVASNLAISLLSFSQSFSILQLKNANIICLLPQEITNIVKGKLDAFGLKTFNSTGREKEALIEAIIESNRNQVLITMNGLLNYSIPEEIINQYKILGAFNNLGFKILNVWTTDLLDNNEKVLSSLTDKLLND